jgi:glycosyltransferase involved in cell wall biosynthesis
MKILMVLNEEFPPDYRVEKEAISLQKSGHEILILCYTTQKNISRNKTYKGIRLRRFKINKKLRKKLHALYLVLPFYKWIWKHQLKKTLKKESFDVIHVHDLPLTDIAVNLKEKFGYKLVCDQHEYYSNWIGQNAHLNTGIGKIVNKLSNWKKYEKKNLLKADLVVTIEEPLRQEYINEIGIDPSKITITPNAPDKKFQNAPVDQTIINHYKKNFVVFYSGGIDIMRGIDTAIKALPILSKAIPEIKIVLAGKIWKNINPIDRAKELGVEQYLDFVGWIPVYTLPSYIAASDICFHIPPVLRKETNKTVATKIYQYIVIGKPIICGQAKMMKNLVLKNKIGMSIKENDPDDFAKKVIFLYKNKNLRKEYEQNSIKISDKYLWDNSAQKLIEKYKNLI